MSFIECLKCKIKNSEFYDLCKKYKIKDKMKENFNEKCYLKFLDREISRRLSENSEELFNSLVSIDDFDIGDSKKYKIGD